MSIPKYRATWERHGLTGTPEHLAWKAMKARCYNARDKSYEHYGGRGIGVCRRWQISFLAFLDDMGKRTTPHHSLDRIDVNGNYAPGNCRWATRAIQSKNIRKLLVQDRGITRLYYISKSDRWSLTIRINGEERKVGTFGTRQQATRICRVAADIYELLSK